MKSSDRPSPEQGPASPLRPSWDSCAVVGEAVPRIDGPDKAAGRTRYVDDMEFAGCLEAALVVAGVPHGILESLDVEEARAAEGVVAVALASDVPGLNQVGAVIPDQPLLVEDRIRFQGDRVALIAADTREHARLAVRLVKAGIRTLPPVVDPVAALEPGSQLVHDSGNLAMHQRVRHGDWEAALGAADVVVDRRFQVNYQEHAYIEPQSVVAVPREDGGMVIHGSLQAPHYVQAAVARVLGVSLSRVQVIQEPTGGAFGGKEDYPSEPSACAAVLARLTGRPVRLVYDRATDVLVSSKRHRMKMHFTLAASRDGRLLGVKVENHVDAGGYLGLSSVVAERANCTATGPYRVPTAHVDTYIVYTNNLFGGAYRGFGAPQVTFAMESAMDELADRLGLDRVELRRRNLIQVGDSTITGQVLPASFPSMDALERLAGEGRWAEKHAAAREHNRTSVKTRKGVGLAAAMYGCCLHAGGQHMEGSGALVQVHGDGSVSVAIGGTEIGQGSFTVMAQIAAEELGCRISAVTMSRSDTHKVPDSGPTVASRTTVMSGNAVRAAAAELAARLRTLFAGLVGAPLEEVVVRDGEFRARDQVMSFEEVARTAWRTNVPLVSSGWYAPPPKPWDKATGQGTAYSEYCFGAHLAEVEVDLASGLVRVARLTAVHDVGKAINPQSVIGQAHGGMVQGMGWALSENLAVEHGRCLSPGFGDYLIPTSLDVPEMEVLVVEDPYPAGPFGAKGIGEPTLISVPAAVALAVRDALGTEHVPRLPLTPEAVLELLHGREA